MKIKFAATVEQAGDGSWTAAIIGEDIVLGSGDTKEAALENLREGVEGLMEYLKSKGQTLPRPTMEVVDIEVAA